MLQRVELFTEKMENSFNNPKKEIKTLEDLLYALEKTINIPQDHRLIAVFENNESDIIKGFLCVKNGVEGDYPVLSFEELLIKYGERKTK